MEEFWEKSFRINKEMWGWEPTLSAINTLSLFNKKGFKKILILFLLMSLKPVMLMNLKEVSGV